MPALESVEEVARRPGGEGRSVAAYFGRRVGYHRCRGESSGETSEVRAEVLVLGQVELEELDVNNDLRLGLVVRLDDFLSDADLVGRIADGNGVEGLQREEVAGFDHRPDDARDLLGIAIREVERADDEVFVV